MKENKGNPFWQILNPKRKTSQPLCPQPFQKCQHFYQMQTIASKLSEVWASKWFKNLSNPVSYEIFQTLHMLYILEGLRHLFHPLKCNHAHSTLVYRSELTVLKLGFISGAENGAFKASTSVEIQFVKWSIAPPPSLHCITSSQISKMHIISYLILSYLPHDNSEVNRAIKICTHFQFLFSSHPISIRLKTSPSHASF